MKRRDLLAGIGCAAVPIHRGWAQPIHIRKVGILIGSYESDDTNAIHELGVFREALSKVGWREGDNLRIEYRWGGGNIPRIQSAAAELAKSGPDIIVTRSSPATAAVLRNTSTIPVVFVQLVDPVSQGFVKSFAHPETNATGFTNLEASLPTKWLALIKELLPGTRQVGFLYHPDTTVEAGRFYIQPFEAAAQAFGIVTRSIRVGSRDEIASAIQQLAGQPGSALLTAPGSYLAAQHHFIIEQTAKHRLPALYPFTYWARDGGLMSYGIDSSDLFRRAASYVDRILRGERAGELPVQAPTKFEMILNLRTAKTLGLQIPPMLLARADQVIE